MRILLDEDLPRRLCALLVGHEATTVPRSGWAGVKNGKLLALAAGKFDVFLTNKVRSRLPRSEPVVGQARNQGEVVQKIAL